jgi:glycosyltransferase involved in cell wall biosynthesis
MSSELAAWIDAFQPELVYGFLGSTAQNQLAQLIVDRWRVPLAIHIMDDWPGVIYTEGLLGPLLRPGVLTQFRRLLDRASLRMVISGAMAEDYGRRYGHTFLPFHNALDMAEWSAASRHAWVPRDSTLVRYVGSIVPEAQRAALRDVCDAVAALRVGGMDITLSVHSPADQTAPLRAWGFPEQVLHIAPPAVSADVPHLLSECDILVLPFNFDDASRRYMRLSMPTKVPAYMISGTPVLVYGPPDLATVAYARQAAWAETVTVRGAGALAPVLRTLATDAAHRERLGRRAAEVARTNHDAVSVTLAFRNALAAAVSA